jgi:hypothetical protein
MHAGHLACWAQPMWLGRLVRTAGLGYLASWLVGIYTFGQLGNLGLMGHAGWQNGGLGHLAGQLAGFWSNGPCWLVGWVGNLSRV